MTIITTQVRERAKQQNKYCVNSYKKITPEIKRIVKTGGWIIVNELLAQYAFWVGRKTGNPSLKADGWHHRSDALSSIIILVGIFFANYLHLKKNETEGINLRLK